MENMGRDCSVAIPDKGMHDRIDALEDALRQGTTVDLPVRHYFSKGDGNGVYARELFIPKGTVLTGKVHKYENLNIMSKGELSVLTEDGVVRVCAPFTIVSPPGTRRVAYAHEDTIWTTIHGTSEVNVDLIEERFIAQTFQEYLEYCKGVLEAPKGESRCLGQP